MTDKDRLFVIAMVFLFAALGQFGALLDDTHVRAVYGYGLTLAAMVFAYLAAVSK